jgi:hypothetical protein
MFSRKTYWSAHAICLLFFLLQSWPGNHQRRGSICVAKLQMYFLTCHTFYCHLGTLVSILVIRRSLPETWSLADALSEDVELSAVTEVKETKDGIDTVTKTPLYDPAGKPVLETVMKASSSRLIALIGMLVILFMFIGFGSLILLDYGMTGKISSPESVGEIIKFLSAGMTLFAPYLVNKFSSLFQSLSSNK